MGGEFSSVHLPARFVSAGQTVTSPGWVHPKRLLNSHVLIVVKQGRFGMAVNGREYVLSAGQEGFDGVRHVILRVIGGDGDGQ